MSGEGARVWWTHRVRAAVTVKGAARAVLYALADRADDDGIAWPGQAQLALDAGLTDRGVRKLLPTLVSAGFLAHVGTKHGVDVWRLTVDDAGRPTGPQDRNHVPDRNDVPPEPRSAGTGTTFQDDRNHVPAGPEPRSDKGAMKGPWKEQLPPADGGQTVETLRSEWARWKRMQSDDVPMRTLQKLDLLVGVFEDDAVPVLRWLTGCPESGPNGGEAKRLRSFGSPVDAMVKPEAVDRIRGAAREFAGLGAGPSGATAWTDQIPRLADAHLGGRDPFNRGGILLADDEVEHARRLAAWKPRGGVRAWSSARDGPDRDAIRAAWIRDYDRLNTPT